jgi:multicomponent Na+:H+ antiporter subunit D
MLGFATVAHVGVMLCGVALLDAHALAGAALYALGFGLAIAALFLATGILALRYGTVDDYDLHGRGRSSPFAGLLYALGGASLACAPLLTSGFGGALIGDAARRLGYGWLVAVFVIAWALTSGAVLRTAACVFLGWGPGERRAAGRPDASEEEAQETAAAEEGSGALDREAGLPALLAIPAVLSAAATGAGLVPGFVPSVVRAAARFEDHAAYASTVLTGRRPTYHAVEVGHVSTAAVVLACAALAGALVIAALALFGRRLADRLPRPLLDAPLRVVDVVRAAHSGHVGDYVAWWTFGAAAIGGLLLWTVAG